MLLVVLACHAPARFHYPLAPTTSCAGGAQVTVIGAALRPGVIACHAGMHLSEALVAAGGFTPLAWRSHIRIRRGTRTFIVPFSAIEDGIAPDPVLGADDVIVIGERDV